MSERKSTRRAVTSARRTAASAARTTVTDATNDAPPATLRRPVTEGHSALHPITRSKSKRRAQQSIDTSNAATTSAVANGDGDGGHTLYDADADDAKTDEVENGRRKRRRRRRAGAAAPVDSEDAGGDCGETKDDVATAARTASLPAFVEAAALLQLLKGLPADEFHALALGWVDYSARVPSKLKAWTAARRLVDDDAAARAMGHERTALAGFAARLARWRATLPWPWRGVPWSIDRAFAPLPRTSRASGLRARVETLLREGLLDAAASAAAAAVSASAATAAAASTSTAAAPRSTDVGDVAARPLPEGRQAVHPFPEGHQAVHPFPEGHQAVHPFPDVPSAADLKRLATVFRKTRECAAGKNLALVTTAAVEKAHERARFEWDRYQPDQLMLVCLRDPERPPRVRLAVLEPAARSQVLEPAARSLGPAPDAGRREAIYGAPDHWSASAWTPAPLVAPSLGVPEVDALTNTSAGPQRLLRVRSLPLPLLYVGGGGSDDGDSAAAGDGWPDALWLEYYRSLSVELAVDTVVGSCGEWRLTRGAAESTAGPASDEARELLDYRDGRCVGVDGRCVATSNLWELSLGSDVRVCVTQEGRFWSQASPQHQLRASADIVSFIKARHAYAWQNKSPHDAPARDVGSIEAVSARVDGGEEVEKEEEAKEAASFAARPEAALWMPRSAGPPHPAAVTGTYGFFYTPYGYKADTHVSGTLWITESAWHARLAAFVAATRLLPPLARCVFAYADVRYLDLSTPDAAQRLAAEAERFANTSLF